MWSDSFFQKDREATERNQGAAEVSLAIDRAWRQPISRHGMRCTRCYEARCNHRSPPLQPADYLWDDLGVMCGKPMCLCSIGHCWEAFHGRRF